MVKSTAGTVRLRGQNYVDLLIAGGQVTNGDKGT